MNNFDCIGGKDVMPILGYFGPHPAPDKKVDFAFPDHFTDEYFQLIADAGINLIGPNDTDYRLYPGLVQKMLELGEKYGLGVLVRDSRLVTVNGSKCSEAEMDECIKDYVNHPAYFGNHVVDEPSYDEEGKNAIRNYEKIFAFLNSKNIFGWGNLLGINLTPAEKYQKYLDDWISICHPPMMSYDLYKFGALDIGLEDGTDLYFQNMTMARETAEKADIPFWVFVQAGSQWSDSGEAIDTPTYFPSQGEFNWSIGSALAFGAKGIQYFPMIQPYYFAYANKGKYDFERNGLIGADGRKTRWHAYAQKMNAQIAAVDEVLMNAVNQGVITSSLSAREHMKESKYFLDQTAWRELQSVSGEAMVGCFDYQGKTAFYVVNYDVRNMQTIQMELDETYCMEITMDAKTHSETGNILRLTITAGNSALVVIDKGGQA